MPISCYVLFIHPTNNGGNLDGNKTPFIQPLAAALNCTIWTSYGLLKAKKDYPLSAANFPGIIFGLLATITAF